MNFSSFFKPVADLAAKAKKAGAKKVFTFTAIGIFGLGLLFFMGFAVCALFYKSAILGAVLGSIAAAIVITIFITIKKAMAEKSREREVLSALNRPIVCDESRAEFAEAVDKIAQANEGEEFFEPQRLSDVGEEYLDQIPPESREEETRPPEEFSPPPTISSLEAEVAANCRPGTIDIPLSGDDAAKAIDSLLSPDAGQPLEAPAEEAITESLAEQVETLTSTISGDSGMATYLKKVLGDPGEAEMIVSRLEGVMERAEKLQTRKAKFAAKSNKDALMLAAGQILLGESPENSLRTAARQLEQVRATY